VIRTTDNKSELDLVFFEDTKVPKFEQDNDDLPSTEPISHTIGVYKIFKSQDGFSIGHKVTRAHDNFIITDASLEVGACYFVSRWDGILSKIDLAELNRMVAKLDKWNAAIVRLYNQGDELSGFTNRNFESTHFKEFTVAELDKIIAEKEASAKARYDERQEEKKQEELLKLKVDQSFKKTGRIINSNGKSVVGNVADFGVHGGKSMRIEIPTELKYCDYFNEEIMERVNKNNWSSLAISLINLDIPFEVIISTITPVETPTQSTDVVSAPCNMVVDRFTVKPPSYGVTMIDGVKVKSRRYDYILNKRLQGIKGDELAMYERFSGVKADVVGLTKMIVPYNRTGTPIDLVLPISVRSRDKYADSLDVTLGTQEIRVKIRYTDFREIVCKGLTLKEKMEPSEVIRMYEKLEIDKQMCMEEFKRLYSLASLGSKT